MISARHKIFRIADNDAGFSSHNRLYAEVEKDVAQKVDLVAYTAKELEDVIKKLNPKRSYYLPNGVDFELFQEKKASPQLYQTLKRPIIVYAGSIDFWFDYDLINRLQRIYPNIHLSLLAPIRSMAQNLLLPIT